VTKVGFLPSLIMLWILLLFCVTPGTSQILGVWSNRSMFRSKIWPWQVLQIFWICAEDYIRESNVYRSDFMGPCDTIINSFFLYIVELTKGLFVGNTLFYFHLEMEQHFLMHLLLLSVFASTFYGYPFFCILHVLNLMI